MKINKTEVVEESLVVKYLAGEASTVESEQVQRWLATNEDNRKLFEEIKKVWEGVAPAQNRPTINTAAAWAKVKTHIHTAPAQTQKPVVKPLHFRKVWWAVAAGILLSLSIWQFFYVFNKRSQPSLLTFHARQKSANILLPDGTAVFLNAGSQITYPATFTGKTREVTFSGEGFWQAAHDQNHPFIIHTAQATITVVGTSFHIQSYPQQDSTLVIVQEGKVRVASATDQVLLTKDEKAVVGGKRAHILKSINTDANFLYYKTHTLVFKQAPLKEVVAKVNGVFQSKIVIDNEQLSHCLLTTTFTNMPLEDIVGIIAETFRATIVKEENRTLLRGGNCM
jgi:ferric-dicitrate binding protein FerR (iron transport regulator)